MRSLVWRRLEGNIFPSMAPRQLGNLHFHVADLSRTGKKCTEIIKACEGRAKVLFLFNKYAKFVAS